MNKIIDSNTHILLKSTFDLATESIFIMDDDGNVVFANESACKHLNYTKAEMLDLMVWDIDVIVNTKEIYLNVLSSFDETQNDDHAIIESIHKTKEGKEIPVKISSKFITIENSSFLISYVVDITEDKEKDNKIEMYFELIKETNEMVFFVDMSTELIEFANNKVIEKLGYTLEELRTMKISTIRKAINHDIEIPEVLRKARKEVELTTLGKYLIKTGGSIFVETSLKTKKYNDTEYIIAVSRDISERLELENKRDEVNKKLENYNKTLEIEVEKIKYELIEYEKVMHRQSKLAAMGEMLENIAHQWRQPLSVISVLASGIKLHLESGLKDVDNFTNNLDDIEHNVQYLSNTIDDFRNYFKPTNKEIYFSIKEVIDYSLKIVKNRSNNINYILDVNDFEVCTFKNELIQVIINLLNNSIDELKKVTHDRFIFIKVKYKNKNLILEIKDNAGGVREDIIERIFEPYFTTKDKSVGTGIGLYMSNEIIRKHMRGDIEAKNKNYTYKNKTYTGAKFKITIPN